MNRKFNVNGDCKPDRHYMVDISQRLREIKKMVDDGAYFTVNRARQYGKTTTLKALSRFLREEYKVINMDFQMLGAAKFRDENIFALTFARIFIKEMENDDAGEAVCVLRKALQDEKEEIELYELFEYLSNICMNTRKPMVLIIDEVDSATNNQVFLDFLAQLRRYYMNRDQASTFWSVILAGVYDVKNIQYKIRSDGMHKTNSPWNIAADFLVDMSFSERDIAGMLSEYKKDYQINMDIPVVAKEIYAYTSGYPFLVSYICKLLDERIVGKDGFPDRESVWTIRGITEAIKILLAEKNTLFESLAGKLEDYPDLHDLIYALLFNGSMIPYSPLNKTIEMAEMLGFIKNSSGNAVISNRVFETVLYNLFLSKEAYQSIRQIGSKAWISASVTPAHILKTCDP